MKIEDFVLERYFAKYEFSSRYLMSSSDCEALAVSELVELADDESKQLWNELRLGYTESQGHPLLRTEISKLYSNVSADDVLVSAPEEAIFVFMNSLLEPGDHIICTFPGYQSLYEIATAIGCEVTKWQPDESAGWKFNIEFLERSFRKNTKLVTINFPHNPTGALPSLEDFNSIVALAKKHDVHLFSDEMYRFLELDSKDRLPAACELYNKGVTLLGMSKTFGLGGLRIGWLATKDRQLYQKMAAYKDYTTICSSAPSEILALMALRSKERIITTHINRIQRNLNVFQDFAKNRERMISWMPPKAGSVAFPRITGMTATKLCELAMTEEGIMILPSTVYGFGDQHFRIGLGRENFPQVLKKLERLISSS